MSGLPSPIVRAFEVECSIEHAFDTWTRRMHLWWPLARHSVSGESAASVAVEPRPGGRIFETTREGKDIVWGSVSLWDPPRRFGYLWHIGEADASEATEVTITFAALGSGRTHVAIVHKGFERAGAKAVARRRANERGWDGLEQAFTRFVKEEVPT
jgi:hypothetical protein